MFYSIYSRTLWAADIFPCLDLFAEGDDELLQVGKAERFKNRSIN